jgi:cytochrome subunit of sulfide dehydrogenase
MGRIMKGYSDGEVKTIANHMAGKEWVAANAPVDQKLVAQGEKIHNDSKCETCHEKNGHEQDEENPRLAGQWPDYTYNMLVAYHDKHAPATQPRKMRERVQKLNNDEFKALAHFYGAQK